MELIYDLSQIDIVAKKIIECATSKTILFYGDLGAGKTTLIKSLVSNIGSDDIVSSPTFSIINEYTSLNNESIFHFDLYRLKDENEAFDMGIDEYLDKSCWKFIEWPEKINIFNEMEVHSANIVSIKENKRKLNFI